MCAQSIIVNCKPTLLNIRNGIKETNSYKRLNEVQGLRGVAIIGVLLFHLWPRQFPAGYLGVDIFFVISGYLMCMLLSRQSPLNFMAIIDFYFRRLKRIFPTYLFSILLTLFGAWFLLSPTDYMDLYHETIKPLFIAANIPDNENADYFLQSQDKYHFFTHMWSLSVELQFYLFVPFLVFFLHRVPIKCQLLVILSLAVASFVIQFNSSKDYEHMHLLSRVWQFMAGFLSHHINRTCSDFKTIGGLRFAHCWSKFGFLPNFLIPFVLVLTTLIKLTPYRQLNRLIVTILSLLVISRPEKNQFLGAPILVVLGDISYSVYLIHWPLLEYYKYLNVELFAFGKGTTLLGGLFLIVTFIFMGQLIEEFFKNLGKYLNGSKSLLFTIFLLYAFIAGMMYQLKNGAIDLSVCF